VVRDACGVRPADFLSIRELSASDLRFHYVLVILAGALSRLTSSRIIMCQCPVRYANGIAIRAPSNAFALCIMQRARKKRRYVPSSSPRRVRMCVSGKIMTVNKPSRRVTREVCPSSLALLTNPRCWRPMRHLRSETARRVLPLRKKGEARFARGNRSPSRRPWAHGGYSCAARGCGLSRG